MHNTPRAAATPSTVHRASGMCLCNPLNLLCLWQRACISDVPGALKQSESTVLPYCIVRHEARLLSWSTKCCHSGAEFVST